MFLIGRLVGTVPDVVSDGMDSPAADSLWRWFVAWVCTVVVNAVLPHFHALLADRVAGRYQAAQADLVAEAALRPTGIAHLDDAETVSALSTIANETSGGQFRYELTAVWSLLQTRLAGITALLLLLPWRWWVALIVVVANSLTAAVFSRWSARIFSAEVDSAVAARRRAQYSRDLLTARTASKEVRLFAWPSWLTAQYSKFFQLAQSLGWDGARKGLKPVFGAGGLLLFVLLGAVSVLALDAFESRMTLSGTVTAVQALVALQAFGVVADGQLSLAHVTAVLDKVASTRDSLGLPPLAAGTPTARPQDHEACSAATVDIVDLSFTYPNQDSPTLDQFNLHVPAGQSVGIVGPNGAGKSTLIKVINGLYRPQRGVVRINGVDPADDPGASTRVAAILQNFVHYPLGLRENIGFGAVDNLDDQALLDRALVDGGGAALKQALPRGWDTVLDPAFEGGTDLSGGQWQRVALARAVAAMASGAGLVILDEPTAALDVRAEAELFDRFLTMTRGVTTLLVSHRLSSVRHADRIVVIDSRTGQISEDGDHDELMALNGEYAKMFRLQAARFASSDQESEVTARDSP